MPCHHNLETYLEDYVEATGVADDREGPLFRTSYRRTGLLTDRAMTQSDAWRVFQRRGRAADIPTAVCNHTFRATGITAYLDNGGSLETAQAMAAHESPRQLSCTTAPTIRSRSMRLKKLEFRNSLLEPSKLYDRTKEGPSVNQRPQGHLESICHAQSAADVSHRPCERELCDLNLEYYY